MSKENCCKEEPEYSFKYLLFLDRLKDLNDAFLIIVNIDAFKDLTIFTSSNFPDNFIVILLTGQRDTQWLGKHYLKRYTELVIC